MKRRHLLICIPMFTIAAWAQILDPDQIHITAGFSVPYTPAQFYDYWNDGIGLGILSVYMTDRSLHAAAAVEFNRFEFDEKRFFKRLGMTPDQTTVEGGTVSLVSIAGHARYRIPGYESARPICYGGLGIQYAYQTATTIHYPFAPAIESGKSTVEIIVPVGALVEFSYRGKFEAIVAVQHTIGITKNAESRSDFSSIRIGFIVP